MYEKCPFFIEYNHTCSKNFYFAVSEEGSAFCLGTNGVDHWSNCNIFDDTRCKYLKYSLLFGYGQISCEAGNTIESYEIENYCTKSRRECSYYKAKEAENRFDEENKDGGW